MRLKDKGRLVLTRKEEQSIVVRSAKNGELMRIKFYGISKGKTKLAIQALGDIQIDRLEELENE